MILTPLNMPCLSGGDIYAFRSIENNPFSGFSQFIDSHFFSRDEEFLWTLSR